jgi:hypothetical protein
MRNECANLVGFIDGRSRAAEKSPNFALQTQNFEPDAVKKRGHNPNPNMDSKIRHSHVYNRVTVNRK